MASHQLELCLPSAPPLGMTVCREVGDFDAVNESHTRQLLENGIVELAICYRLPVCALDSSSTVLEVPM